MSLRTEPSRRRRSAQWLLPALLIAASVSAAHAQPRRLPPPPGMEAEMPLEAADEDEFVPPPQLPRGEPYADGIYTRQWLPRGVIYRNYLAGEKESRMRSFWSYEKNHGWIWDVTLGGRAALFRYGTSGDELPQGFEIGIEGAGIPRLDLEHERDVLSADFRFGIPITFGNRRHQTKLAYYHLSSHLGDEFLLRFPDYERLNYSRDAIVLGQSLYLTDELRLYAEAGWAFYSDVAEPWEFQFGLDYGPAYATGRCGAPFFALNGHLREEVNFGGNFVVQAGWAWRGSPSSGLLRAGFEYFNGKSDQFSFFGESESKVGLALWYDF